MTVFDELGTGTGYNEAMTCDEAQAQFSGYLDGDLDGRTMGLLARHLEDCADCGAEFLAWRTMQDALGELGPAVAPGALQAQLRDVLAAERVQGTYLSPLRRIAQYWSETMAPACVRFSAGLAAALLLTGGATWFIGLAAPVQANDDRMADLRPPQLLYTEISPTPIPSTGPFEAVLVDAKVDSRGRVYDYTLVEGPDDSQTRARIETNLLESVFKPATVFGVPVPGHAMITYTAVSVRG